MMRGVLLRSTYAQQMNVTKIGDFVELNKSLTKRFTEYLHGYKS